MAVQNENMTSLLDKLAAEVMVLEPGDLMTYGDVLTRLEELTQVCESAEYPHLIKLAVALKNHLESMILGQIPDQTQGLEVLTDGVAMSQSILRGDTEGAAVNGFLAGYGLSAPETPPEEAGLDETTPSEPAEPSAEEAFNPEDAELLAGFVAEALEHLESIEVNALVLEDAPEDQEALNAVFRPFHTIKGVSGFLNLREINELAHALENLLDQARAGRLLIESEAIDVVLAGVDMLRQMINESQNASQEQRARRSFDTSDLHMRLAEVLSAAPEENEPKKPLGEILVEKGLVKKESVDKALSQQQKGSSQPIGELLVKQGSAEPTQVVEGLRTQRAMAQTAKGLPVQEVKVDTKKLDNLLDMVGELVIAQSMVQSNPNVTEIQDRKFHTDLAQLVRITTDLQKTTTAMRMVPIKQTFQKMVRVVRDTAKKAKKKAQLNLEGAGTEIDRNMVEKFHDPLMHMVRNSVDHGLETPEERSAAGKPEEGEVVLAAYHKGGSVCIEIRDDGRGLDREKILDKAKERGLVEDGEGLSDEEIYRFMFLPGFSTAKQVTEISGRGVGLDVVQKVINDLRGKVEIKSTLGQGTIFTIALPLTLAIIDGMVVRVGPERFILPTVAVVESLRPRKEDYFTVQGKGEMIRIRGKLVPLLRLHEVVNLKAEQENPWDALVVVVEHHNTQRCLLVDRLVGRQEVVIKTLGEGLKNIRVVAGGAIMGDGRVGLIPFYKRPRRPY